MVFINILALLLSLTALPLRRNTAIVVCQADSMLLKCGDRIWRPPVISPPSPNLVPIPERLILPPEYPCRPQSPFYNPRPILPGFLYNAYPVSPPPPHVDAPHSLRLPLLGCAPHVDAVPLPARVSWWRPGCGPWRVIRARVEWLTLHEWCVLRPWRVRWWYDFQ